MARLNAEIGKAMQDPELRNKLLQQGFQVRTSTLEQLGDYMRAKIRKWAPIVKETGVRAE
ncbi:MAG: hypothetical protein ACHP7E_06380 [Burkholderiales bacterium]